MPKNDTAHETAKTTLYLNKELLRKAKHRAVDEDDSLQGVVEKALMLYLKTRKEVAR